MLKFIKKIIMSGFLFLLFSCYRVEDIKSVILSEKEAAFQAEIKKDPPDFTSPTIEDPDCFVEGIPEKVKWLTSKPKNLAMENSKIGGVFHATISEYPKSFTYIGKNADYTARQKVWNNPTLLKLNPETQEFMPYAASHWAFSADKHTVYFKLNEKAKWSDGVPCTADDFLFALEFMASPYIENSWYNEYAEQFEAKKINDYCISITNVSEAILSPSALIDLMNFPPSPKHFYNGEITKDYYLKTAKIAEPSTGAYFLNTKDTIPGRRLVLNRNPNWWARSYEYLKNTANISRLEYSVLDAQSTEEKLFYDANIDFLEIKSPYAWKDSELMPAVKNGYVIKYVFNYVPLTGVKGICFNTKSKIFSSRNMRRAMYYAFDIQGVIDNVLKDDYIRYHNIGYGQTWDGVSFNEERISKPSFDPATAKKIFQNEGYQFMDKDGILKNIEGDRLSFELTYSKKEISQELIYLKQKAREAGVEIILDYDPNSSRKVSAGAYDATYESFGTWYFPDYIMLFSIESSKTDGSDNIWKYWSPEMEILLDNYAKVNGLQEIAENNKKIERLVDREALVVPTYITNFSRVIAWRWLRFPSWGNRRNIDDYLSPYGYMWIDESIKVELQKEINRGKSLEHLEYHLSKRYLK